MEEIIRTESLTKHFGKVKAVDDISLTIKKGEIYGFLGLNGAGKTTTIRMLLGMIKPTSGTSLINGRKVKPGNREIWRKTGYMVEVPYAYPELTVQENLEIFARLRMLKNKNAVSEIIEKLKLTPYKQRKAKFLSQGNAQRLGLAKALIHNPEIIFLDEPANALDPAGIVEIRELLLDQAQNNGTTVFISSHILGEVSKFAKRIGIIHNGKLVQETDTEELNRICKKKLVISTLDNNSAFNNFSGGNFDVSLNNKNQIEISDPKYINHPEEIATFLVNKGLPPTLLKIEEEDLESYFLRVTGTKEKQQ